MLRRRHFTYVLPLEAVILVTPFLLGLSLGARAGVAAFREEPCENEETFERLRNRFEEKAGAPVEERILLIPEFAAVRCDKAVDYLRALYKSETNPGIHIAVTETLGRIGTRRAIEAVIREGLPLLAGDAYNCEAVARALSEKLDPEAEKWFLRYGLVPELRKYDEVWLRVLHAVAAFKSKDRVPVLLRLLSRAGKPAEQVAILEGLRDSGDRRVLSTARRLANARALEVRLAALDCLAEHPVSSHRGVFLSALKSKEWKERLLAFLALAKLKDRYIVERAVELLSDPEPRVQVAAVRVLLEHGGPEVIPPLIEHLDKTSGRVQDDIADALARLTGKNLGPYSGQWESWWAQNKDRLIAQGIRKLSAEEFSRLKEADREQRTLLYHGLRVAGDRLIFIIDTSESMAEVYVPREEREEARGRTVVEPKRPKRRSQTAKIEVAKRELKKVLDGLPNGKRIDVIRFDSVVVDFIRDHLNLEPGRLVVLDPRVRAEAHRFVDAAKASGQTYMLQALETAFAYEEADTIFLLSDGAPTPESGGPDEILRKVRRWNRLRNVRINTIGFHLKEEEKEFLRQLADENFGVFIER